MTNLDSILKSRDITLSTKVRLVKAMVFPVVTYGCDSWTIKKASVQFSSVAQSCPTLCNPMNHNTPGPPVHHQLPEFTQTHVIKSVMPSLAPKNWCFLTVVLEKTLVSPLDCKESQPVHPKGNRSWVFIGRTDVKAETPVFWPPDGKSWLIWKDPDAGKDWRQEEKGTTEDKMVRWHHQLNGHEFAQTPGDDRG